MADAEDDTEEKPVAVAEAAPAGAPAWADTRALGSTPAPAPAAPASPPLDSMVVTPEQQKALQDRLVAIKRNQMASSGGAANETIQRLRSDRAQMEEAFKATAMPADDLAPWDAKAKSKEYKTDPVEAFGSLGSVFAMLASSFAKVPMEYALNAGADAINAVHAGDDKAYERDFTSWKENTQIALKRHEIQRQAYNDSILKMNTNLNAGRSEMEMAARRFGDAEVLAKMEAGLGDEHKLFDDRNRVALELQKTADEVWLQHEKTMDLKKNPDFQSGDEAKKQRAIQDWEDRWRTGGKSQLKYDFTKDYIEKKKSENKDYSADDLAKWGQEAAVAQEVGGGTSDGMKANTPEKVALSKWQKEFVEKNGREPTSDENLDFKRQWTEASTKKTATPERAATDSFATEFEAANGRKPNSEELTAFHQKFAAKKAADGAKLSPEDASFLAQQALRGDTSVFTNLGRGAQGAENVIAVRRAIREQATAQGMKGDDIALRNAEYQGERAAQRVAGSREAIISIAANEAKNMMKVAEDAAARVPRTRWVPINNLNQYLGKQSSDPDLAAFAQANESLVNGYVRAISPTGTPTDLIRKHAYNALTTAQGSEAYAAVLRIMEKEMDAALHAPEQVKKQMYDRHKSIEAGVYTPLTSTSGDNPSATKLPAAVGGVIRYDSNGNRIP